MHSCHARSPSAFERSLALLLAGLLPLWGACLPASPLAPYAGLPDYARINLVPVPGGSVNTAGGNLHIRRSELSLDTPLGTQEIAAVYNSASGEWLWNFQMYYDGTRFVDFTGYDAANISPQGGFLTPDGTLPGTIWVRVDDATVKTKGGLAYHFDPDGRLAYLAWATMDYPRITFSDTLISQCTQASSCAPIFTLTRNTDGNPLTVTDARTGREARFGYDAFGRLESARSPLDVELGRPGYRYEYSAAGGTLLTAQTNSEGERIEYTYQAGRRILFVTQIGEGSPQHRFDFFGKDTAIDRYPTVHRNPKGGETSYLYSGIAQLAEIRREESGDTLSFRYGNDSRSGFLRPRTITNPSGATTTYTLDENDDVVQAVTPAGNTVTQTYDPAALNLEEPTQRPPLLAEDDLGLLAEHHYGPDGRVTRIDLPEGESIALGYQGIILKTLESPFGIENVFNIYGVHGHWIDASVPSSSFPVKRAFDTVGNLLVPGAGLQEGGVLDRLYNAGRQVSQIDVAATAEGAVTSQDAITITRRSDGRPLRIERPRGADHEFVYDALGRLSILREAADGQWQDTRFEYDANGNLTARERPNGMREEFGYDDHDRVVRRAALRDGVLEGEALIAYASDLPSSVYDSARDATESYAYDGADRLQTVIWSGGESLAFGYDLRNRVTEQVYQLPGGPARTLGYEYDGADRQRRVLLDGSETLAEFFYSGGKQTSVHYGNGLVRDASFDSASGRIAGFTTTHPTAGLVEQSEINREALTNPPRYEIATTTTTPLGSTEEHYYLGLGGSLSNIDRRVGNRVWGWHDGQGASKRYVYDELSNLLSNSDGDLFTYNAERNRLLSASLAHEGTSVSYGYDAAGFATSRNGDAIQWTATGRLASVGPVSIEWDMADRPIAISVAGVTREFGLFGGAVEGTPGGGSVGSLDLGLVEIPFAGGERLYRHQDFRGNTSFVSDEAGAVLSHYRYSAYGLDAVLGSDVDPHRFAGRQDTGTGLVLMGARIYDAYSGRFLSPDPIFQFVNAYSYTLGDPVQYWDPDGADAESDAELEAQVSAALAREATAIIEAALAIGLLVTVASQPELVPIVWIAANYAASKTTLEALFATKGVYDAFQKWLRTHPNFPSQGSSLPERSGSGPCKSRCGPTKGGPTDAIPGLTTVSSCAPGQLNSLPDLHWPLRILIPLQLALAAIAMRKRRNREFSR